MKLDPYNHGHNKVEEIPWSRLGNLLIELANMIRKDYSPEIVIGIAKGGVIPAVFLSSVFQLDFFPIKLSSRHNEKIVASSPIWHVNPTNVVKGKKILIVDDICIAGRTLRMANEKISKKGAIEIRTTTIAVHESSFLPDYYILKTDALIVWPWDRDVLAENGKWLINREYLEYMAKIPGYIPGSSPAREHEGRWER